MHNHDSGTDAAAVLSLLPCPVLRCPVSCVIINRLKAKGLLADIQGEWDDWQHDLLLDTIQLQLSNPGAVTAQPARQRRGRAEMEGSAAAGSTSAVASAVAGSQEPRRVGAILMECFQGGCML